MIDFDKNECNSIKSIAIKGNTTIEETSRFVKGKMLMFSKVSIRSFVYDLIDVFWFPDETVKEINILSKFNYKMSSLFMSKWLWQLLYFFQFYL